MSGSTTLPWCTPLPWLFFATNTITFSKSQFKPNLSEKEIANKTDQYLSYDILTLRASSVKTEQPSLSLLTVLCVAAS